MQVYAVSGLVIASCRIEGVESVNHQTITGIWISTVNGVPTPTSPGKPDNVSGTLLVANNDIDVAGGTALDNTLGVIMFSVGVPGAEVEAYISGNKIRNVTEPAININRVSGRVYVERNVLTTGSVVRQSAPATQAIRVVHIGSYVIAHNSIDCGWGDDVQGIGVYSPVVDWPMERAIVVDNDVNMEAPEGRVFGPESAGIMIEGFAQGNVVLNNRIRGRARAALSVNVFPKAPDPRPSGFPADNAFVLNRFDDFEASAADVFVDEGVTNTRIFGPGTVEDHGVGTIIVPLANFGGNHEEGGHENRGSEDRREK